MKILVPAICTLMLWNTAFAEHKFKYFKLGPLLTERTQLISKKQKELRSNVSMAKNDIELEKKLFGQALTGREGLQGGEFTEPDADLSPVYKKILDFMAGKFQSIGNNEVNTLLAFGQDFGGGVHNFSGFSWEKPMGTFSIGVNRQISPDLFNEENWLVHDLLVIQIDAQTFLRFLGNQGMINIDAANLQAFAGIQYQRIYETYHYSDSYLNGLKSDFSKLFLPFIHFRPNKIVKMRTNEVLKREDYLSVSAGAMVTTPTLYGFSFSGGAHASFSRTNQTSIQSLSPEEAKIENEFLRISVEKTKSKAVGVSASLQLDFFSLVKLALLTYDYEYSYEDSKRHDLKFYRNEIPLLISDGKLAKSFKHLIKGRKINIDDFQGHIVSHEQREAENHSSNLGLFIYSKKKKSDTEFIRIIRDNGSRTFFKHYNESVKVVKNLVSKILGIAVNVLLEFDIGAKSMSTNTKHFEMEYESQNDQNDMIIDDTEKFSVAFTQKYDAARTDKKRHKLYNKKAAHFLAHYTTLDKKYQEWVKSHKLRGPLRIDSTIRVNARGLRYFHALPEGDVYFLIAKNCGYQNANKWKDPSTRRRLLSGWKVGKRACVKSTGKKYLSYIQEARDKNRLNLKKLKDFFLKFYKKNKNFVLLLDLFGRDKVFLHGTLEATTDKGGPFKTFFNEGEFEGLGVIDKYRRSAPVIIIP